MTRKKSPGYSKRKGSDAERDFAIDFREIGFQFCKTTRLGSKLLDNCGIDLCGIPFSVQIKCGYKGHRPKADVLFKDMKALLKENFPPDDPVHNHPKILIHKLDGYHDEHVLATLTWEDLKVLIMKAYGNQINSNDMQKN
jgi:hypothetical protein